jgi:hypothetical protein
MVVMGPVRKFYGFSPVAIIGAALFVTCVESFQLNRYDSLGMIVLFLLKKLQMEICHKLLGFLVCRTEMYTPSDRKYTTCLFILENQLPKKLAA